MNIAHIHLIFNHFPIIGSIIGFLVLIWGLLSKNDIIKQTALGIFMFSAIMTIPAYVSGDGAAEVVKNLAGVKADIIDQHEDLAAVAMILIQVLGVLSLASFYFMINKHFITRYLMIFCFVISLTVIGFMVVAGYTGGKIRHSEMSTSGISVPASCILFL
jgi:hypothetical protein